jgi:hypothetical protein
MKTFKQFLAEQENDTFVYCFGRYSPTTRGHIAHFQAIKNFAEQNNIPYMVYTSKTVDNKKNPIPVDAKIAYIKKAMPDLNIAPASNMFKLLDELIPQGYKKIIYFAGGDYFDDAGEQQLFTRMQKYAADQGVELSAMSSGDRTPGISGSDLRKAVTNGDFDTFAKASPLGIGNITEEDVAAMFTLARQGLGLDPVSEGVFDFLMPKEDRLYYQMRDIIEEINKVENYTYRDYLRNRSKQGWVPKNIEHLTDLASQMKSAYTMKKFDMLEQLIALARKRLDLRKTPSM